eukprot:CAMPEP_0119543044 /NCGR_PEP_ID=MMETSP1344-20130328/53913_1 /TAXON_ID=236787 /ORGANISM="Florenciella parvula, Strain CCMP2471" /LENGTH=297 /DNA_ID=CAMNT_0007587317 /DNA_START=105 /DNA_END=994 /DNA_ORIENTATION=-
MRHATTLVMLAASVAAFDVRVATPSRPPLRDRVAVHAKNGRRARTMPESGDPTEHLRSFSRARENDRTARTNKIAEGSVAAYTGPMAKLPREGLESMDDLAAVLEEGMRQKSLEHFKHLQDCPALVLNADFQPLSFVPLSLWSWQEAVKATFMNRVTVVATYDKYIRSANCVIQLPSVIALKDYVNHNKKQPAFTRRNIFLRDRFSCQYCGNHFSSQSLTFDHVNPRARGGGTSWCNVVAACQSCNNKKGDLPLSKIGRLGMRLLKEPRVPSHYELQAQGRHFPPKVMHPTWNDYLV